MMEEGMVADAANGDAWFGRINTFVSYAWWSGESFASLVEALEATVSENKLDPRTTFFFVDILCVAQNRGVKPNNVKCPNKDDVNQFEVNSETRFKR